MGWCSLLALLMIVSVSVGALAQSPTYGLGRTPTAEEVRAWDISIPPDGKGLPPGKGTAKEGAPIYAKKCAWCHGRTGVEGPGPILVIKGKSFYPGGRSVGNHWPFATIVWDYINRAMPMRQPQSLTPDEVYALSAYTLYLNGVVGESDVMDARSLPKVQMPNREGFRPPPLDEWTVGARRPFP